MEALLKKIETKRIFFIKKKTQKISKTWTNREKSSFFEVFMTGKWSQYKDISHLDGKIRKTQNISKLTIYIKTFLKYYVEIARYVWNNNDQIFGLLLTRFKKTISCLLTISWDKSSLFKVIQKTTKKCHKETDWLLSRKNIHKYIPRKDINSPTSYAIYRENKEFQR